MMKKIILARHMETAWNEQLRYIGRTDLPLSELGERHARALAAAYADVPLGGIVHSGMKRAEQTAAAVAAGRDIGVSIDNDLREIDFGDWEGLDFDQISAAYPDLADIWVEDPFAVHIPGGEPMTDFMVRVRAAWARLRSAALDGTLAEGGPLLIVTHAGCIKVILGAIMGLDDRKVWEIYQDKGAVNVVEAGDGGDTVAEINNTAYRAKGGDAPRQSDTRSSD